MVPDHVPTDGTEKPLHHEVVSLHRIAMDGDARRKLKRASPHIRPASVPRLARPSPKRADAELQTSAHEAWALAVKRKAQWRCERCNVTGVRLYADHILERQDRPDLALSLANGQALCASCHGKKSHQSRLARLAAPLD